MNISKSLLVIGLLVTSIAQADKLSERTTKAGNMFIDAQIQTEDQKVKAKSDCQNTEFPEQCEAALVKAAVRSIKGGLKQAAKTAKNLYKNGDFVSKEEKEVAKEDYKTKKEAYHTYRGTFDKVLG